MTLSEEILASLLQCSVCFILLDSSGMFCLCDLQTVQLKSKGKKLRKQCNGFLYLAVAQMHNSYCKNEFSELFQRTKILRLSTHPSLQLARNGIWLNDLSWFEMVSRDWKLNLFLIDKTYLTCSFAENDLSVHSSRTPIGKYLERSAKTPIPDCDDPHLDFEDRVVGGEGRSGWVLLTV